MCVRDMAEEKKGEKASLISLEPIFRFGVCNIHAGVHISPYPRGVNIYL